MHNTNSQGINKIKQERAKREEKMESPKILITARKTMKEWNTKWKQKTPSTNRKQWQIW